MRPLVALATCLVAGATTITFDDLPPGQDIATQYQAIGVSFNMSYGRALSTGTSLEAVSDFSYGYSFLTVIFNEPQPGSTISFDLKAPAGNLLVVQTYSWEVPDLLVEELFIFGPQTVQLTDGRINLFTVIDATPHRFEMDNLSYGTTEVPEPGHVAVVLAGLIGIVLAGRRFV